MHKLLPCLLSPNRWHDSQGAPARSMRNNGSHSSLPSNRGGCTNPSAAGRPSARDADKSPIPTGSNSRPKQGGPSKEAQKVPTRIPKATLSGCSLRPHPWQRTPHVSVRSASLEAAERGAKCRAEQNSCVHQGITGATLTARANRQSHVMCILTCTGNKGPTNKCSHRRGSHQGRLHCHSHTRGVTQQ